MKYNMRRFGSLLLAVVLTQTACTYNPMIENNHLTGSVGGTAMGAIIGAGATAIFTPSKPMIGLVGLTGAGVGYYLSTLGSAASGIVHVGGQGYTLGDYVGIEIPTDNLFDPNTADFLPENETVLQSIVAVLKRYPKNNILISGNTSGFNLTKDDMLLSENRATQIAAFLWEQGVGSIDNASYTNDRKLMYVGFGNYFSVANNLHLTNIRANSRIQITAYPPGSPFYRNRILQEKAKPYKVSQTFKGVTTVKQGGVNKANPSPVDALVAKEFDDDKP